VDLHEHDGDERASRDDSGERREDARAVAMDRVASLASRFPDLGLPEQERDEAPIPPLARAIEHEVRRRWLTLAAICERSLDRGSWQRLEPRLKATLLVGAAQLLFLDGEPDHAVVDAAVSWASKRIRRGAGGLANAVLRRVAESRLERLAAGDPRATSFERHRDVLPRRDGSAWRLASETFAAEPVERLSEQTSHGRELLLHWTNAHGFKVARDLAAHGLLSAPTILAGPETAFPDDACLEPHEATGFRVFVGEPVSLAKFLEAHPRLRVQDPGSAAPVEATAALRPRRILDLCAGRGTKTRQLAARHPTAEIVAVEPNESRRQDLERLAASLPQVRVIGHDGLPSLAGSIDLALLDVPCSNTAVLPRRPEARYRFTRKRLEGLVETQREIARAAEPLLSPSAAVLYATCSLEPAENERQAAWIAERFGMSIRTGAVRLPRGLPGESASRYADGGFHALLER
jgi:16S rRNA (cytosine967-C5)-methyltransferase